MSHAIPTFPWIAGLVERSGHSIDIHRPSMIAKDDIGGREYTYEVIKSGENTWVQAASSFTIERYGRNNISITHFAYVADSGDVRIGDHLHWHDPQGVTRELVVRGVVDFGGMGKGTRIEAEEIGTGV